MQISKKLVSCFVTKYCHLKFNHACKRKGVLPKSLRYTHQLNREKISNQLVNFLNLRINKFHKKIGGAKALVEKIRFQFNSKLNSEDFNDLMNYSDYKKSKVCSKTEYIHNQKVKQLISREREIKSLNQNPIKNLSSRSLTNAQKSLLKKGNKFETALSKIPVLDIISGVEFGLSQVNFANKCLIDSARSEVVEILKRAKPPKPNLPKPEKRAMEELKQYDDIVILNADKS